MTITSKKIFKGPHDNNIQKDIQKFQRKGCNIAVSYINAIPV